MLKICSMNKRHMHLEIMKWFIHDLPIYYKMLVCDSSKLCFSPVRMAAIQKSTSNKCWRGCGEKGTLLHCWWECKLYSHYGEQCGDSLKNWKQNCHMTQQFHFWAYTPRKPDLKETRVPQCSSQHCLSQPGHGSNLDAHQQTNG